MESSLGRRATGAGSPLEGSPAVDDIDHGFDPDRRELLYHSPANRLLNRLVLDYELEPHPVRRGRGGPSPTL